METTNQIFSWKRYTAALRKEWVENRTMLLLIIAVTLVLIMALHPARKNEIVEMFFFFVFNYGFVLLACIVPSLAYRQLKSKSGRAQLFTLPTSMTEKFAVGITIYVVGMIVVFVACVLLADGVLYLVSGRETAPDYLIKNIKMTIGTKGLNWNGIPFYSWTALAGTPPLFLLGSVLWPRWSAIKTLAVTFAGSMVLSIGFFMVQTMMGQQLDFNTFQYNHQFIAMTDVVNIITIFASLVLAWYLFKRKDIVSLKWWK